MSNRTLAAAIALPQLLRLAFRHWKVTAALVALIVGFVMHPAALPLFLHTVFGGGQ